MPYKIKTAKIFRKNFAKLCEYDAMKTKQIITRLANDENLEPKYNDHKLHGEFVGYRECHIKPDLLLIYKKIEQDLVLYCLNVGAHSMLF